jgi:hypothetical protein
MTTSYPKLLQDIEVSFWNSNYTSINSMKIKRLNLDILPNELKHTNTKFDLELITKYINEKCLCKPLACMFASDPQIGLSSMCDLCFNINEFVNYCLYPNNEKGTNIFIDFFINNPINENYNACIKKLYKIIFYHFCGMENKITNEEYKFIDDLYQQEMDKRFTNIELKHIESENMVKILTTSCDYSIKKCDGCELILSCGNYIGNNRIEGYYGSTIMDMHHVHITDREKLPQWFKIGNIICDWCLYSLIKSKIVSNIIDNPHCSNCSDSVDHSNSKKHDKISNCNEHDKQFN